MVQQHHYGLEARPRGSWDRRPGRRLAMFGDRKRGRRGRPGRRPSDLPVTGLSQPRGKGTHRTARRGPINVRPSPCAAVMADKRLSGSSRGQSTRDTCAARRSVPSEGITPTRRSSARYNLSDGRAETLPLSYSAFQTLKNDRKKRER